MAAFRFHISKMYSLPLDSEKKQKDCEIIQTIAKNNNIPQNVFQKLNRQVHRKIDCKLKKKTKKKMSGPPSHITVRGSARPPLPPANTAYQLCYEPIHGRTTCQPDLTTFLQPRHIPTRGYNITQSSAPDDGHMVARNMLSNY